MSNQFQVLVTTACVGSSITPVSCVVIQFDTHEAALTAVKAITEHCKTIDYRQYAVYLGGE